MQNNKVSYFMMGLGVAYLVQSLFNRMSQASDGSSQVRSAQGSNVIDLVAWRRDMQN
jgi:hypothetical protein